MDSQTQEEDRLAWQQWASQPVLQADDDPQMDLGAPQMDTTQEQFGDDQDWDAIMDDPNLDV